MPTGKVKQVTDTQTRGYFFVVPDDGGKELFSHAKYLLRCELEDLERDCRVSYDVEENARGPVAINVRPLG